MKGVYYFHFLIVKDTIESNSTTYSYKAIDGAAAGIAPK